MRAFFSFFASAAVLLAACIAKDDEGASASTTSAGTDESTVTDGSATVTDESTGAQPIVCQSVAQSESPDPSGMRWCTSGQWTRETPVTCFDHGVPTAEDPADCDACDELNAEGFCASTDYMFRGCYYPCLVDDDCGPGFACICATDYSVQGIVPFNTCVEASLCRQNSDCASELCMLSVDGCGAPLRLACVTDEAECSSILDCGEGYDCRALTDAPFTCIETATCV